MAKRAPNGWDRVGAWDGLDRCNFQNTSEPSRSEAVAAVRKLVPEKGTVTLSSVQSALKDRWIDSFVRAVLQHLAEQGELERLPVESRGREVVCYRRASNSRVREAATS